MSTPTRDELVGPEPIMLDEQVILKHFLTLTDDQFLEQLRSAPEMFQEDFMWMAIPGLRRYLPIVLKWLREPDTDSWEMSHGLLCSLSFQSESRELPEDVTRLIAEIADFIDGHRTKFDVGTNDLLDEYVGQIRKKCQIKT